MRCLLEPHCKTMVSKQDPTPTKMDSGLQTIVSSRVFPATAWRSKVSPQQPTESLEYKSCLKIFWIA